MKEGLKKEQYNFNCLDKLAYIYKSTGRYFEARCCYILCKHMSKDNDLAEAIEEKILQIERDHYDILKLSVDIDNKNTMEYKTKVILYGTKRGMKKVKSKLNHRFKIIGCICEHEQIEFNDGTPIITPSQINQYDFDYIIIATEEQSEIQNINLRLSNVGITNEKVFEYFNYDLNCQIEGFDYMLNKLIQQDKVELLIAGSSDTEIGIDCDLLKKPSINFSLSGQDIFYIYRVVKYLLNFKNVYENLKYVVLGLQYFSFDFDLSSHLGKDRIHRYYENLKTIHNNDNKLVIELLNSIYNKKNIEQNYERVKNLKKEANLQEKDKQLGQYYAEMYSTMNNPETLVENKEVLKELLQLLKSKLSHSSFAMLPAIWCFMSKDKNKYFTI